MVSTDQVLNQAVTDAIVKVGHSRLPVFKGQTPTHIVGTFLVKQLVSVNPENSTPLIQMVIHKPLVVGVEQSLLDVLTIFQQYQKLLTN